MCRSITGLSCIVLIIAQFTVCRSLDTANLHQVIALLRAPQALLLRLSQPRDLLRNRTLDVPGRPAVLRRRSDELKAMHVPHNAQPGAREPHSALLLGRLVVGRHLALVAFVLDDPVHRLVRDLDTVEHLESDVVLLPGGVGMLVPEAALEHFLAAPTYAADAPDLGSGLQPLVRSRSRSALTLWCLRVMSRRGMLVRKTASSS